MEEYLSLQQGPLIPDVACHVFSFLQTHEKQAVALVCRFWRNIVYLPSLWKNVQVILPLEASEELFLGLRKRKITRVTVLRSTNDELSNMFTIVPNITHISLGGCPKLTEKFLQRQFCISLSNLKSLTIEDCETITSIGFKELIVHLRNLEVLDLTWCENLNDECLRYVSHSCPKLRVLSLRGCDWVSYTGVNHGINSIVVKLIANHLPDLQYLDVKDCPCNITNNGMLGIVQGLCHLKSLILSSHPELTNVGIKHITNNLKSLTSLDLMDCCRVTNSGVALIAKEMPQLVQLNLSYCYKVSNQGAIDIGKNLKELRQLTLEQTKITDKGFVYVCHHLPNLQSLAVGGCPITDKGLVEGSKALSNLEELDL
ncbi:predicted protein, partial [Nematostella vectensis]